MNPQDPNENQPETNEAPEQPVEAKPVDPEVARLQQRVADLETKTRELEEQTRHYAAAYDRARSEFAAAKDRIQRENERTQKRDQIKLVTGLLGVLDSLDRSLESVKGQTAPGAGFVEGVQLIRSQLETALAGLGMKRFDGVGEPFDPSRHQAVTLMPVPDQAQDNQVIHGVAAGVVVGDEVVRPASVVVGKFSGDTAVH